MAASKTIVKRAQRPAKRTVFRIATLNGTFCGAASNYLCWLRTAKGIETWTAESKRAAISSVKAGVKAGHTEGGIEGQDIEETYTWDSETGKIV